MPFFAKNNCRICDAINKMNFECTIDVGASIGVRTCVVDIVCSHDFSRSKNKSV